ncbi:MAG: putative nucleotidyltransferase substrate binding domain-containing protein [Desulfomonile sp.]
MTSPTDVHGVARHVAIEFLQSILPFKDLTDSALNNLTRQCVIAFFPRGTLVLEQDVSEVEHLYIIQKGGVKASLRAEDQSERLVDYHGDGAQFGAVSLLSGSRAKQSVETVEDTFCFLLRKQSFLNTVQSDPHFAQYYLKSFSEALVGSVYTELRSRKLQARPEETFYLFSSRVEDVINHGPQIISGSETIHQAASRMADLEIGSLLVADHTGNISGIVTDKDLRKKVVAARLDYDQPVENVMASPVYKISADATCFDAVLEMMSNQVHHLVVERQGRIIGVVTAHDILVFQGSSPLYLLREIVAQRKIEGLYTLSAKVPTVVRSLIEEGAKANNITRMISVINDRILERLLTLMQEQIGPAPVPFCWMMMGSEGRKEQTFRTDQDNAIMYENPSDKWEHVKAAKLYFRQFGNEAIEHLTACGYPLCKGGMMASKSRWRKPYSVWIGYFDRWMSTTEPQEMLNAKIFFDFRAGYGDRSLGDRLRDYLVNEASRRKFFLNHLAKDCLAIPPPLSFFRNFLVEKDGEHKNRLDLKLRGLVPFVDFARMMALKHGIKETNTLGRLQMLGEAGHITGDMFSETLAAYEFLMQLRLVHQLKLLEAGREPHNFVDPAELSDLEKATLKEAFGVVNRIQSYVTRMRSMI